MPIRSILNSASRTRAFWASVAGVESPEGWVFGSLGLSPRTGNPRMTFGGGVLEEGEGEAASWPGWLAEGSEVSGGAFEEDAEDAEEVGGTAANPSDEVFERGLGCWREWLTKPELVGLTGEGDVGLTGGSGAEAVGE